MAEVGAICMLRMLRVLRVLRELRVLHVLHVLRVSPIRDLDRRGGFGTLAVRIVVLLLSIIAATGRTSIQMRRNSVYEIRFVACQINCRTQFFPQQSEDMQKVVFLERVQRGLICKYMFSEMAMQAR